LVMLWGWRIAFFHDDRLYLCSDRHACEPDIHQRRRSVRDRWRSPRPSPA
jgi:hypothetical protein